MGQEFIFCSWLWVFIFISFAVCVCGGGGVFQLVCFSLLSMLLLCHLLLLSVFYSAPSSSSFLLCIRFLFSFWNIGVCLWTLYRTHSVRLNRKCLFCVRGHCRSRYTATVWAAHPLIARERRRTNTWWNTCGHHARMVTYSLTALLGARVHLLGQSRAAAQCVERWIYRSRALVNVYIKRRGNKSQFFQWNGHGMAARFGRLLVTSLQPQWAEKHHNPLQQ